MWESSRRPPMSWNTLSRNTRDCLDCIPPAAARATVGHELVGSPGPCCCSAGPSGVDRPSGTCDSCDHCDLTVRNVSQRLLTGRRRFDQRQTASRGEHSAGWITPTITACPLGRRPGWAPNWPAASVPGHRGQAHRHRPSSILRPVWPSRRAWSRQIRSPRRRDQ